MEDLDEAQLRLVRTVVFERAGRLWEEASDTEDETRKAELLAEAKNLAVTIPDEDLARKFLPVAIAEMVDRYRACKAGYDTYINKNHPEAKRLKRDMGGWNRRYERVTGEVIERENKAERSARELT